MTQLSHATRGHWTMRGNRILNIQQLELNVKTPKIVLDVEIEEEEVKVD